MLVCVPSTHGLTLGLPASRGWWVGVNQRPRPRTLSSAIQQHHFQHNVSDVWNLWYLGKNSMLQAVFTIEFSLNTIVSPCCQWCDDISPGVCWKWCCQWQRPRPQFAVGKPSCRLANRCQGGGSPEWEIPYPRPGVWEPYWTPSNIMLEKGYRKDEKHILGDVKRGTVIRT